MIAFKGVTLLSLIGFLRLLCIILNRVIRFHCLFVYFFRELFYCFPLLCPQNLQDCSYCSINYHICYKDACDLSLYFAHKMFVSVAVEESQD